MSKTIEAAAKLSRTTKKAAKSVSGVSLEMRGMTIKAHMKSPVVIAQRGLAKTPHAAIRGRVEVKPASWYELLRAFAKGGFSNNLSNDYAVQLLDAGMPARLVPELTEKLGLTKTELSVLMGLDRSTATRLSSADKTVPAHSSEVVLRLLELHEMAVDVFGSEASGREWLNKPHPSFGGEPPIKDARSSYGADKVKEVLTAIKYGGAV